MAGNDAGRQCRHFFTKEEVETFLDAMAMHKLNTFHWHLVDDQGWRIEIKEVSAARTSWRVASGPLVCAKLDPKSTYWPTA